jgi:hypothetical protein
MGLGNFTMMLKLFCISALCGTVNNLSSYIINNERVVQTEHCMVTVQVQVSHVLIKYIFDFEMNMVKIR